MGVPTFRITQTPTGLQRAPATMKQKKTKKGQKHLTLTRKTKEDLVRARRAFRRQQREAHDLLNPNEPPARFTQGRVAAPVDPTRIKGIIGNATPEQVRIEAQRRETEQAIRHANAEQAALSRTLARDARTHATTQARALAGLANQARDVGRRQQRSLDTFAGALGHLERTLATTAGRPVAAPAVAAAAAAGGTPLPATPLARAARVGALMAEARARADMRETATPGRRGRGDRSMPTPMTTPAAPGRDPIAMATFDDDEVVEPTPPPRTPAGLVGHGFSPIHRKALNQAMDHAERGHHKKAQAIVTRIRKATNDPTLKVEQYIAAYIKQRQKEKGDCTCRH